MGTLSPVTGAWLTALSPSVTNPSAGIRSFGFTITVSPSRRAATETAFSVPSRRTSAVSGASSASDSMAWRARPIA